MTAVLSRRALPVGPRGPLPTLARFETVRLLRNPLFVVAVVFTGYAVYDSTSHVVYHADEQSVGPAAFLGGLGMIAACLLTQSLQRSAEALDVTPALMRVRTLALCLTTLVPLACGLASLIAIIALSRPGNEWTYGTFDRTGRFAVEVSQIVLPPLGGPLLGIALGRWIRARWVGPAAFLAIFGWIELTEGLASSHQNSAVIATLRLFAPFAFFTASDGSGAQVETWRGSPIAFAAWQLCLCGIALIAALLYGADRALRRRLVLALCVLAALAATSYTLAVTGGLHHALIVRPGSTPHSF